MNFAAASNLFAGFLVGSCRWDVNKADAKFVFNVGANGNAGGTDNCTYEEISERAQKFFKNS
jgi:hypothetical protein